MWALKFWGLSALSWPEDKDIPLSVESQGTIFRVGRRPNPWQPPDWSLAGPDGTFGNRFDDPDGTYRVLYASSQRLGCYLETLARFRVDLTLYAELSEIAGEDDFTPLGHVPPAWAKPRMLGSAEHDGKYADLYGSDWIGLLRRNLPADCLELGITELDASVPQGPLPERSRDAHRTWFSETPSTESTNVRSAAMTFRTGPCSNRSSCLRSTPGRSISLIPNS